MHIIHTIYPAEQSLFSFSPSVTVFLLLRHHEFGKAMLINTEKSCYTIGSAFALFSKKGTKTILKTTASNKQTIHNNCLIHEYDLVL